MLLLQYNCTSCGVLESKLLAAKCNKYRKRVAKNSQRLDIDRKLFNEKFMKPGGRIAHEHHALKALAISNVSSTQTTEKFAAYSFRTEIGGQLKVLIRKKNGAYRVFVEIVFLMEEVEGDVEGELIMSWGLFRSNSSSFMPLNFEQSSADSSDNAIETPFIKDSVGRLTVELNLEASLAPFYVSFQLKSFGLKMPAIRSHRKTSFVVPVGFGSGRPSPLGLSSLDDGSMNFAFFSRNAENVVLCLYSDSTVEEPALEIDLDPYVNRSGDIWHALIDGSVPFVSYGYRCSSSSAKKGQQVLLDPYAKVIQDFGSGLSQKLLGKMCEEPPFDWSGDSFPRLPSEKLVVYRLNVTRFTKERSSKLPEDVAGTFSGISEKLPHFKSLGVNAVLLEPIFPFDEKKGPYFPLHFFSPASSYGLSSDPISIKKSMKEMIKTLHANGIEVLLEVVFTHIGGGTLAEIDGSCYHIVGEDQKSRDALNCNHPVVQQMILDSLRQLVIEYHVDGFCFINASSLMRDRHSEFLSRPPLVEAIAFDPLLSNTKIIADTWDPHVSETSEVMFPHWKRWAEMNAKFCVDVRNFLRGEGSISSLATRICGSGDVFFSGRGPAFSFNFVTRNVGLTLVDLVSFSSDRAVLQLSWNCGEEGPTRNSSVLERRLKQIRNYLFILFIALGVPVINMGDECGQSCAGSTEYSSRRPLDWNALRSGFGIQATQFISFLSSLRERRSDLLQRRSFLGKDNIEWHGSDQSPPNWDDPLCKFLAVTLKSDTQLSQPTASSLDVGNDLFLAFNGSDHPEEVTLPPLPDDVSWVCLVDTALPFPGFFSVDGIPLEKDSPTYKMKAHSCVMLEARSS